MNARHPASTTLPVHATLALIAAAALAACSPTERQEVRKDTAQVTNSAGNAANSAAASAEKAVENAGKAIDDAGITAKVKSALLADDQVKGLQINVDTATGTVTLTGSAQTDAEKMRAEQLAAGVEGVRSVQNNITVAAMAATGATKDPAKPAAAKSDRAKGGC